MKLSILIPTFNQDCTQLVHDLLEQLPQDAEILVADDKQNLANYIIELLSGQELHDKISLNGNSFVKLNYSWQTSVKKLYDLLRQVVCVK